MRIEEERGQDLQRGEPFRFVWNDEDVIAYPGETVLGALLAAGTRTLGNTEKFGDSRFMFCGTGACFACLVAIDGHPQVRSCITPAVAGLNVSSVKPIEQVS